MANSDELAELIVGGKVYSAWTSVSVEMDFTTLSRFVRFQAVEDVNGRSTMAAMQIKPGDLCEVKLAGQKVMKGFVFNRQASYNATQHGVMIAAGSATKDLVYSTVRMSETEFKDYSYSAIAKKVIQPYGIKAEVKTPPPGFDKKFRNVSAFPGETVFAFLERLARMRGVFLHDDENGNMVIEQLQPGKAAAAALEEGRNILSANCTIDDQRQFSRLIEYGQHQGYDERNMGDASNPAAEITGPSKRFRERHIVSDDQSDDAEDLKRRVTMERNAILGTTIEATITVQGWRKSPGGKLWDMGEIVSIKSPMLLLDHDLGVKTVTFSQTSEQGTTTTLGLVLPEFMSSMQKTDVKGDPNLFNNESSEPRAITR